MLNGEHIEHFFTDQANRIFWLFPSYTKTIRKIQMKFSYSHFDLAFLKVFLNVFVEGVFWQSSTSFSTLSTQEERATVTKRLLILYAVGWIQENRR